MFIPTKIIAKLKHKSKKLIKQINYKGLIMYDSFWKYEIFYKNDPKIQIWKSWKFHCYIAVFEFPSKFINGISAAIICLQKTMPWNPICWGRAAQKLLKISTNTYFEKLTE